MHPRLVTSILAGGIAVAWPGPAAAQPVPTQADRLFQQGRELLAAGKYAEACAAFDASDELDPTIATLVNQASCREKNGQLATAWTLFVEAERRTRATSDESTRQLHQLTVDRAARLAARRSTLTINIRDDRRIEGLEIMRDGDRVDPAAWSKAVPIDGGTYTITARAPGSSAWSITIMVGVERDLRTVEVPGLEPMATSPPEPASRPEPAPAVRRRSIVPLALAGSAVVLLGGAAGLARWGDRTYDKARAATDRAEQTSLWHAANHKRYAAEVMLGAGIGLAGVAAWWWLRRRTESSSATAARSGAVSVTPLVHADSIGLDLTRSW